MKSFNNFQEDMEQSLKSMSTTLIPQLKNFAKQNQKSPKELTKMRDGITSKVTSVLGKKLDVPGLINKIPDSGKFSDMARKTVSKANQKFKDPKTSQQFNKIFDMIDGLQK